MNQQTKPTWSAAARLAERLAALYAEATPEERQILEAILCPATPLAPSSSDADASADPPEARQDHRSPMLALAVR